MIEILRGRESELTHFSHPTPMKKSFIIKTTMPQIGKNRFRDLDPPCSFPYKGPQTKFETAQKVQDHGAPLRFYR